jgi:hypothetical protein
MVLLPCGEKRVGVSEVPVSHAYRSAAALSCVLLVAASAGCSHRLQKVLLPESRPEIRLTRERLAAPGKDSYAWLARWSGGGVSVDHYLYAIDPTSVDVVDARWVSTTETQQTLTFPSQKAPGVRGRPHVFAVRAVGPDGAVSDPAWFAFAQSNIPPTVQITSPIPSPVFTPNLPQNPVFRWTGTDPDGQTRQTPVQYKFRIFGPKNPDFPGIPDFVSFALLYPDSLMAMYAPGFAGWDSLPGDSTSTQFHNLNPGSTYLFAITAFDEVGDYDPFFQNGRNMMKFSVGYPGTGGPLLTMFNQFFNYHYPNGGYFNDAAHTVPVEMPAGQPPTVNWFAEAPPGAEIHWYRWVLAPVDLFDETPRTDEQTDLHHWSARSATVTSATLPAINPPPGRRFTEHLYIEVEDTNGLRSLGIVEIIVQQTTIVGDLLFVDDTRLRPDFRSGPPGTIDAPAGPWPTAAELDTFLFARGGVPWRGYPQGTLSTPGIFNGYAYDTLGTRGMPGGVLPLSLLSGYRHVVWYTDEDGATYNGSPSSTAPITALRLMSSPNQASSLAAYIQQGGQVWLGGGGAAYATLIAWNNPSTSPGDYNSLPPNPELRPGRFMYDFSHWREGIQMLPAVNARKFGTVAYGEGTNRPGRGWPPNPPPPTPPTPPDYGLLPANLDPKSVATDPPPPLRQADGNWLRGTYNAEYISRPTLIREDYNDDPNVVEEYSTLDTLYIARSSVVNAPAMTYYHGRDCQPVVFSGFNFWYWRRTQCIQLVDWVLQSVWGLPRDPGAPRTPGAVPVSAAGIRGAAITVAARPVVPRGGTRQ